MFSSATRSSELLDYSVRREHVGSSSEDRNWLEHLEKPSEILSVFRNWIFYNKIDVLEKDWVVVTKSLCKDGVVQRRASKSLCKDGVVQRRALKSLCKDGVVRRRALKSLCKDGVVQRRAWKSPPIWRHRGVGRHNPEKRIDSSSSCLFGMCLPVNRSSVLNSWVFCITSGISTQRRFRISRSALKYALCVMCVGPPYLAVTCELFTYASNN